MSGADPIFLRRRNMEFGIRAQEAPIAKLSCCEVCHGGKENPLCVFRQAGL